MSDPGTGAGDDAGEGGRARRARDALDPIELQVLTGALRAACEEMVLVGYGGLVSLGHASFVGLTSYAAVLMLNAGFGQLASAVLAILFSTFTSPVQETPLSGTSWPASCNDA